MRITFREATDGIPAEELADALGVTVQTARQYRQDPSKDGYRPPPDNWPELIRPLVEKRALEWAQRRRRI